MKQPSDRLETHANHHTHGRRDRFYSSSTFSKIQDHRTSPHLSAIPEPEEKDYGRGSELCVEGPEVLHTSRALLRIDPFLGEWLTPDYFESITPPPTSKMMVAGAKAELLRCADPIEPVHQKEGSASGRFPGGWSDTHPTVSAREGQAVRLSSDLEESGKPPKLARAKSHSAAASGKPFHSFEDHSGTCPTRSDGGYAPPVPSHALSPSQPIPQGYVDHAKDACVDIDYQWDSMRQPLEWGTGGEYGEEWSAMHRRFRKGLDEMAGFYTHKAPFQEWTENHNKLHHTMTQPLESEQNGVEDIVLILVTHGAGCNALIGAVTNQPVLMDVGLASLTMAVRKAAENVELPPDRTSTFATSVRRRSSADTFVNENYDLKYIASTDHLKPGSRFLDPTSRARSPSLPVREKSPYRYERHVTTPTQRKLNNGPARESPLATVDRRTSGSFEENPTYTSRIRTSLSDVPSKGLWTKSAGDKLSPNTPKGATRIEVPEIDPTRPDKQDRRGSEKLDSPLMLNGTAPKGAAGINGQHGLWGTARSALTESGSETPTSKRRWTMGQA